MTKIPSETLKPIVQHLAKEAIIAQLQVRNVTYDNASPVADLRKTLTDYLDLNPDAENSAPKNETAQLTSAVADLMREMKTMVSSMAGQSTNVNSETFGDVIDRIAGGLPISVSAGRFEKLECFVPISASKKGKRTSINDITNV